MRATCSSHLILLDLIILIIGENVVLCSLLQHPATSLLLDPNILF